MTYIEAIKDVQTTPGSVRALSKVMNSYVRVARQPQGKTVQKQEQREIEALLEILENQLESPALNATDKSELMDYIEKLQTAREVLSGKSPTSLRAASVHLSKKMQSSHDSSD